MVAISAREAATLLGGQATSASSLCCPGPGHSPRDRSLSIRFDPDAPNGFLVHSFANDDPLACRDHVRAALGLGLWERRREQRRPRPVPVPAADEEARVRLALSLWEASRDARGTLVDQYLASRSLTLDDAATGAIRFHPALRYNGAALPAMVALLRDLRTDAPCGVHRTFLRSDGSKVDRRMLGRARGAAIKLDPDENVALGLVVAEGIESALAAQMLGYRPCWALGSASAIAALPVLPGIEGLTIVGEAGDGGANERASKACAKRWLASADVSVLAPVGGDDANDILQRMAR